LNDLLIIGGATTVIDAVLLVEPVPPFEALTAPLVLFFTPAVAPVTVTVIVQLPLFAIEPPLKLMVPGAVVVSVPPHADDVPVGTVSPEDSVSVNVIPFSVVVVLGLVTVNVSTVVPPSGIVIASNDFEIDGGPTTVSVAVFEVVPAPLSFELIAPVVLSHTPVIDPVTVTLNEQFPPAESVPPVKLIVLGAVVDTMPPQVAVGPEVGTVMPAGSVSVNAMPVSPSDPFGFVMLNVRLVVALSKMLDCPNDLLIVGGVATVTVAVFEVVPVPPLVEVTAVVWLFFTPAVVPVTVRLIVHGLPNATVAPLSTIRLLPVIVNVPPQ
jgi:hypothetical protein